jgi:hypothetical protein
VHGEAKTKREYEKSIYEVPKLTEFKCIDCQSNVPTIERVSPLGKIINAREGEILLAYPGKGSSASRLNEKVLLAKGFDCPICKSKKVSQAGEVLFRENLQNKQSYQAQEREVAYLFGTCEKCK